MGHGANAKLREISTVKSMMPTVIFMIIFAIFGYVVLKNSVVNQNIAKPTINPEKIAEYKKQIEENIGIMYDPLIAQCLIENWDKILKSREEESNKCEIKSP